MLQRRCPQLAQGWTSDQVKELQGKRVQEVAKTEGSLVIMVVAELHYLLDWVKDWGQELAEMVESVLELLQVQGSKKAWERVRLAEVLVVMMG